MQYPWQKDIFYKLIYKSIVWILKIIFLSKQCYTLKLDDQLNPLMLTIYLKHNIVQIALGNRITIVLAVLKNRIQWSKFNRDLKI